jgi:hypothetical protein
VHVDFAPVGELKDPWRWVNADEKAFGLWLLHMRQKLLAGGAIDLRSAPDNVRHVALNGINDHKARLGACLTKAPNDGGCVLILANAKSREDQRRFARQTPGAVLAENVDMSDLVDFARSLNLTRPKALETVVMFAALVMTNVGPNDLLARVASLRSGKARRAASETEAAALRFTAYPSYDGASQLLGAIGKEPGVRAHRPAVLRGCYRMLDLGNVLSGPTPHDAALQVREQYRLIGRPLARRMVGSTLLLKGLEADVSVILNPELMDRQHLYVAMTRGARLLVVCSNTTTVKAN